MEDGQKQDKPLSAVDKATEALAKLDAANAKMEENIARMEELTAERILSGQADAGSVPAEKKEETPLEYKERFMSGEIE